jgi:hypothetical protein
MIRLRSIAGFVMLFLFVQSYAQLYFQQEVNYKIDVKLDDMKHEITAFETIEYTNNSPNELTYIYFHLWPNAYKNINTAWAQQMQENGSTAFYFSAEEDKGYIDQLDFRVNNSPVLLIVDPQSIDIGKIILSERLPAGGKITITTPFHVKIANGMFSRMGHEDQQYQITQWYPKPAVYDREGWHQMSYLDQGEFYSEFGSFDVAITVPKNYVVGATGNLQDEEEKQWMDRKAMDGLAYEKFPATDTFPKSDPETKTIHFKQNNVHDFAWFCDKRYNVMKSSIELPHTHHIVNTWALFTNGQGHLWKNATKYVNDALYNYSLWNGDYPYNNCTAVDGALSAGGGMEYPTITVINATSSAFMLDDVIAHEVGHNWFYGILGSNERAHAWMDEGINTFNENRYLNAKYPDAYLMGEKKPQYDFFDLSRYSHKHEGYLLYTYSAAQNTDEPCDQPAEKYTKLNYGGDVYSKTGLLFDYLMAYLGEDIMDKSMQQYFDTWKFKHPQPNDLRKIIEEVSGKDLGWFFDDMLKTTKKLDYKIMSYKLLENGSFDVVLKNTGDIKGPVAICGIREGKLRALVWYDGFAGTQTVGVPPGKYDYFKIDYQERMPEINRNNNIMRTHGLFKKVEPLKLQPFMSLDNPDKTQLFFSPILGMNNYNKFMLGAAVYNITTPEKCFEYIFAPMYGFGNKDIAGYGSMNVNFHPDKLFQAVSIGVNAARFAYAAYPFIMDYSKIAPQVEFIFRNKESRNPIRHILKLRSVNVFVDDYYDDTRFSPAISLRTDRNYTINQLLFTRENKRIINPYSVVLDLQQSKDFVKTSVEAKYEITFKGKEKSLDFRFFAGTFLDNSSVNAGLYRFRTSGWTGYQDYMYDHIFLGRSETSGKLSQQFVERDGGFKTLTFVGQTAQWITALNIKSSIPGLLPIRLYADIGMTADDARLNNTVLYDGGIDLSIVKNVCEIYFPIVLCDDFKKTLDATNVKYGERIRFTLNINLLNPFNMLKNIKI